MTRAASSAPAACSSTPGTACTGRAGNLRVVYQLDKNQSPVRTEVWADKMDLAALSQITNRLPVGAKAHAALTAYAPKGLVERLHASWEGSADAKLKFTAQGRVTQLAIAAQPVAGDPGDGHHAGNAGGAQRQCGVRPDRGGGRASIALVNGAVDFPGVFEEPLLPFASLSADAQWQVDGQRISVRVPSLKFSNDDAQGEAQVDWKTADGAGGKPRLPRRAGFARHAEPWRRHPGVALPAAGAGA